MPITPLHVGILAPINYWFPKKVSNVSFILINLIADGASIMYYVFGVNNQELHGPITHSFVGAIIVSSLVALLYFKSSAWIWGAYLGGISHILLDMFVHAEMLPLYPYKGNPFFWGHMDIISLVLTVPLIWLISQYVSCMARQIQMHREV